MNKNSFANIISQKHLLSELAKPKSPYKNSILKRAQPELILAICESIYNILEGKLSLNEDQKDKLQKYKKTLRKLAQKNKLNFKKKLLIQSGGFLSIILPSILELISTLIE